MQGKKANRGKIFQNNLHWVTDGHKIVTIRQQINANSVNQRISYKGGSYTDTYQNIQRSKSTYINKKHVQ